jgi:hypothetical protein
MTKDALLLVPQAPAEGLWQDADLPAVADLIREVQTQSHPSRTILWAFSRGASYAFTQPVLHYNRMSSYSAWALALAQIPFIINFFFLIINFIIINITTDRLGKRFGFHDRSSLLVDFQKG